MKVVVFGAASNQVSAKQKRNAKDLGRLLASFSFITLMTGGGDVGLMKQVTDGFLEKADHSRYTGIPVVGFDELVVAARTTYADTIGHRYDLYFKDADLIITLPGGHGTLGEFYTAISNKILFKSAYDIVVYDPSYVMRFEIEDMEDGLYYMHTIHEPNSLFTSISNEETMYNFLYQKLKKDI